MYLLLRASMTEYAPSTANPCGTPHQPRRPHRSPRDNPEGSLGAFLEGVSLVADADQIPDAPAGSADQLAAAVAEAKRLGLATLVTPHTAQGLDLPGVFLPGMDHVRCPHARPAAFLFTGPVLAVIEDRDLYRSAE